MTNDTISDDGIDIAKARQRHPKAIEMARRGLELVRTKTTDQAPAVHEQPVGVYLDPARFETEVDVLFHQRALFVALSVELPQPGAFKTLEIPRFPLIVVRGQDGVVRAFLNTCRHRGSSLVQGTGLTRAFVCKYHGWAYDLDGKLRKVRAADNFGEPGCAGLIEVAAAERYGMVFARPRSLERDPSPIDVDEVLGDELAGQLEGWHLNLSEKVHAATVETASNWKLAVDTYLETYHFATLHKTTVAKTNFSDHAPFDVYGPHSLTAFLDRRIERLADQPEDQWRPLKHVQMVYVLFPNTIMTVMQDHVEYSMILPGRTHAENSMEHLYFSFPDFHAEDVHRSRFDNTQWILAEEDCPMAEEMFRNVEAGVLQTIRFGRNEPGLQHQYRGYEAALAEAARR
jgi:phenylpropionate dioxygenase-like ring-hydroxylating dioxygenase large terminal subunit